MADRTNFQLYYCSDLVIRTKFRCDNNKNNKKSTFTAILKRFFYTNEATKTRILWLCMASISKKNLKKKFVSNPSNLMDGQYFIFIFWRWNEVTLSICITTLRYGFISTFSYFFFKRTNANFIYLKEKIIQTSHNSNITWKTADSATVSKQYWNIPRRKNYTYI